MLKKIALIVLCLVLVAAVGLVAYNYYDRLGPQLSAEQKEAISAACAEAGIAPVNWDAEDREAGAVRYYGTFKGYEVFFLFKGSGADAWEPYYSFGIVETIIPTGGRDFYAYKDGKICTVKQLVEAGTFAYEDLEGILKQHNHRRYKFYGTEMELC